MNDVLIGFEKDKLRKQLSRFGSNYLFKKYDLNEFNEPNYNSVISSVNLLAIYHENATYISAYANDSADVSIKINSLLLCDYTDSIQIEKGMITEIEGKNYVVTGMQNLSKFNVYVDISLEEIKI